MIAGRIYREERQCSQDDMLILQHKYSQNKMFFRIISVIIIVIAIFFPFVPSKYKPHNAMVDIMSYPIAILCILGVFIISLSANYYFLIYKLKKDLSVGKKIVLNSFIAKRKESKYRGNVHYYVVVADVPYSLARHIVSLDEYKVYKDGTPVIMEYAKYSKQFIRLQKVWDSNFPQVQ